MWSSQKSLLPRTYYNDIMRHNTLQRGEEAKFDGYKELQKVLRSLKTKAPMSLPDTLRQDELRKTENFNSY